MILADAEKLARELMTQFGLMSTQRRDGWRFEFDDAKRSFGCCHRSIYKITLSREITLRNEQPEVEDCIRHEIAHALCEPRQGHGVAWKTMCKRTGAKPVRCYNHETVDAPKGDWQATCKVCGHLYHKFRRPKRDLWCGDKKCKSILLPYIPGSTGRWHPQRKLEFRHKNALPEATPNPEARRKAVETVKARLKAAEQEPGAQTPELIYQCAKCDRKSISFHSVCPECNGDMMPESKLRAEKEELKKRIAELQAILLGGKK
jgi:predicted SprT family Zn-dependent metalloprotease